MIEIDGAHGEGGGAILRQALGMAVYAGEPIRIANIRAGRPRPGLAPQHTKAVEAVAAICGAQVDGAALGSTEITFEPGQVKPGVFAFDIGTAGSTTLFPALASSGSGELNMHRRGYYPKGGGRILARLKGGVDSAQHSLDCLQPGEIKAIKGVSHAASALQERRVAERQADAADHMLKRLGYPVEIAVEYSNAACLGSGITLWTESQSGPPLGGYRRWARRTNRPTLWVAKAPQP
jgi:RNA 3'-terminal phosphate cyclase